MKTTIAQRLLRLNRDFYDTFADEFADSRTALQPGIVRALQSLGAFDSLLDVGCGDGRVGRALASGLVDRQVTRYLGLDYSSELIGRFAVDLKWPGRFEIMACDLAVPGWAGGLGKFDAAVCLSALHHIPGRRRRLRLLREMRSLLKLHARCAISVWQFLQVPRLRRKVVAWPEAGLSSVDVDDGDYLVDWQRGGHGLRYVHQFDEAELIGLCRRAGFRAIDTYRSDGETDDLGLYILVEAVIY